MVKAAIVVLVSLLSLPSMLLSVFFPAAEPAAPVESPVSYQAPADAASAEQARLLHMLSLNSAFGSSPAEAELVKSAEVALLDYSEFYGGTRVIDQKLLENFIKNFYGADVDAVAALPGLPAAPAGYVAIPAMGYSVYEHTAVTVEKTGGSIVVVSAMSFCNEDGMRGDVLVKSCFEVNPASSFGYNLLSSEIL